MQENMESQQRRNFLLPDSGRSVNHRHQSVKPKNWQRNQRKSARPNGVMSNGHGRIEKQKNSWKDKDCSFLSNVTENSVLDSFLEKSFTMEKKFNLSQDFNSNGIVGKEFLPFKNVEPTQFNHTFPKPIGWGRKRLNLGGTVNLGSTLNLDGRGQMEPNYMEQKYLGPIYNGPESCFGILHSKMDPIKRPECAFCKRNNAKDYFHLLKDELGGVVCPILSAFTCKMCAATGRNAHTHKYCPVNPITKGDPVAAGMPPGRPLTKADKEWLQYFHTKFLLQLIEGNRT